MSSPVVLSLPNLPYLAFSSSAFALIASTFAPLSTMTLGFLHFVLVEVLGREKVSYLNFNNQSSVSLLLKLFECHFRLLLLELVCLLHQNGMDNN